MWQAAASASGSSYQAVVTLKADALAPYVWLQTPFNGTFSDNAFMLFPSTSKEVTFSCWDPKDFSLPQFEKTLQIVSIQDTN